MFIKRRTFLQTGALATTSMMIPGFLKAFESSKVVAPGNKVLVVLQLNGGNDGLNTVIPVEDDLYYKLRPQLSIGKQKTFSLKDNSGLHPALPALKSLYDDGCLAILNSVGYPNPDRSHFRSMDIWQSASESKQYINTGWLGRYLDAQCATCRVPTMALEVDDALSLALKGEKAKALAIKNVRRLYRISNEKFLRQLSQSHQMLHPDEPADYLYKTMADAISGADYIYKQSGLAINSSAYPKTEIGNSLKTIASLICSDINTKVYYLSIGSFDTHVGQDGKQQKLFSEINDAIESFVKDLKSNRRFEDVMLMTFSEFGRRVAENASYGTDHGTAINMFFISGALKKSGLINEMPDLGKLIDGDIQHTVDFKDVYATLLNKWLGADDEQILGKHYNYLDFI